MDTKEKEQYVFNRLCISDLQECIATLKLLDGLENDGLKLIVIKSAIVSYARPFKTNYGKYNKRLKQDAKSLIPSKYVAKHHEVMEYRDQFIAHTDISFRNPQLLNDSIGHGIGMHLPELQDLIELSQPLIDLCEHIRSELWIKVSKYI
ncbi:MAG: hypothetical protein ABJV04_18870 [Aliiglaciecola sp.]|uniref:hypothetical protein n=1 Tax=Aliiglaciecola sp. TaxID=1872441 RepID=UPI00329836A1